MSELELIAEAETILSESDTLFTTMTDTLEFSDSVTLDSIDVSSTLEASVQSVQESTLSSFLLDDETLSTNLNTEVDISMSEAETGLQENGTTTEALGADAGGDFAQTIAQARTVADQARSSTGVWAKMKKIGGISLKVVEAYIVIDFIGTAIVDIITTLKDSTKSPPWKGALTEEQKNQLMRLQDAMQTLKPLFEGWENALKPLEKDTLFSYGTMKTTVGGQEPVQVIDVVAHLIQDTIIQLNEANGLLKDGIDGLSVFDLTQLSNYIFAGFANAQALINLRDNKGNLVTDDTLALFKFPPKDDDKEVNRVLVKDFPKWQDMVKSQASTLAKMGASMAVGAFAEAQVILKVNLYLRDEIYPDIRDAAKNAAVKSAKQYMTDHRGKLIETMLIPIFGRQKARTYVKELQKEALKVAREAAQKAGKAKAEELQKTIESKLKPMMQEVVDTNKENMAEIGKYAAQQILNTVVPRGATKS